MQRRQGTLASNPRILRRRASPSLSLSQHRLAGEVQRPLVLPLVSLVPGRRVCMCLHATFSLETEALVSGRERLFPFRPTQRLREEQASVSQCV